MLSHVRTYCTPRIHTVSVARAVCSGGGEHETLGVVHCGADGDITFLNVERKERHVDRTARDHHHVTREVNVAVRMQERAVIIIIYDRHVRLHHSDKRHFFAQSTITRSIHLD